jgi:hypothetical protein
MGSAYVGSYYRLSRRGVKEASQYGMDGFLYVPWNEVERSGDLTRHYKLARLYAPANWVNCQFFGGAGPIQGITWRLSD